jgi:DNA-binding NarL/FixJ family response regulator
MIICHTSQPSEGSSTKTRFDDGESIRGTLGVFGGEHTVAVASNELTPRQQEIAALAAAGFSNKEIARNLGLTEGSVKQYLHTAFEKLGIKRRFFLRDHVGRPADLERR